MNVTILTTSFPEYQGDLAGIFVAHLARELSRQALRVQVIAPHSAVTPKYEMLENVGVSRFQYFYPAVWQKVSYGNGIPANLKSSMLAKIGLLPFLVTFFLKVLCYKKSTDVYHAQWIFSGLVAVLGQRIHKKPVVLTVRGSDLNLAHGKLLKALVRYIFDKVSVITTVSEALRREVLNLGIYPEKVHTIPNGIDRQKFRSLPQNEARKILNLPIDSKIVLWVGRLVTIKGVEFLIQAIPHVLAKEPNTLFVLIGTGDLENHLRTVVQQKGVARSVMFTGKVSSEKIPFWLNAADVFVLPSLNEGRPNVILEAMACEIPVIATDVGGIPELVKHGRNGFLISAKNSTALARNLLEFLGSESLRVKMGKTGRKMIFEMGLSWEQCAEKMRAVYQQTMTRGLK